jgi:glutaredoxin
MNFTIYSKSGCPYCTKIKLVMEKSNLNHVIYNLDEHFTREEFYKEFGEGSTFPQVVMDNQRLGGCVDAVRYLMVNKLI